MTTLMMMMLMMTVTPRQKNGEEATAERTASYCRLVDGKGQESLVSSANSNALITGRCRLHQRRVADHLAV